MYKQKIKCKLSYKKIGFSLFLFFLSVFPLSAWTYAADMEQQLKTVFLGRLPSFIQWPTDVKINESQSFELCLLGDNSLNALVRSLYENKLIKGMPVNLHFLTKVEETTSCHLLFISESKRKNMTEILDFTKNKPILTIGETRGFAEKEGMIQFYMIAQKVRIKINYQVAIHHGFKIKAPLLSIANVINR